MEPKKWIVLLLLCGAAVIISAQPTVAGGFYPIQYECDQLVPKRDGLWCTVKDMGWYGQTLLIRLHTNDQSPLELRKRAKYLVERTVHNFLAMGGVWIIMRHTNREIACKKRYPGGCGGWHPNKDVFGSW